MIAVPLETPLTVPEGETVATPVKELPHVPPVETSASSLVPPMHTVVPPVMADGNGFTVICDVTKQPVERT
jgi:hypothetical protein